MAPNMTALVSPPLSKPFNIEPAMPGLSDQPSGWKTRFIGYGRRNYLANFRKFRQAFRLFITDTLSFTE